MTMHDTKCAPKGITLAGVIVLAGGIRKVANACGVTRSAVWQWTRVPNRHVLTVANLALLAPETLRPDLFQVAQ